jgi:cell fate (sporulation/competence/biofilm development) regulator YlbF (YheA/YmcA/DUF963 family)
MYVPIAQRKEETSIVPSKGYVPVAQRTPAPVVKPFDPTFKTTLDEPRFPSFNQPTNVANTTPFIRPKDAPTVQSVVGGFGRDVGQTIVRSAIATGISIHNALNPKKTIEGIYSEDFKSFLAQGFFETLTGKEGVKDLATRVVETESKIKDWQKNLDTLLETPGLSGTEKTVIKTLANIKPSFLGFAGVVGSTGLDLTPFGGLEKNVYKTLVKTATEGDALILLKRMGVADDIARNYALDIAKVSTEKDAKKLFENIVRLQQETKLSLKGAYMPVTERVTDAVDVQKIKNSIAEGEMILKSGKNISGRKMSTEELQMVQRSVNNSKEKLGEAPVESRISPKTALGDELIQEAKKYKSAEEFRQAIKGGKTQYGEYSPNVRSSIPAGYKNIAELGVKPDEMVTVYRGIDDISGKVSNKKINDGDFVTTDFDSALSYTGDPKNVVEMQVPAKTLYNSEPRDFIDEPFYTGSEYIYTTKSTKTLPTDSQLTDIWNKANKVEKQLPTPEGLPKIPRTEIPPERKLPVQDTKENIIPSEDTTPKVVKKSSTDEEVVRLSEEFTVRKDAIEEMKGKQLLKYTSKTTGELPEVTGKPTMKSLSGNGKTVKNSEFGIKGDDIAVNKLGFKSLDDAREQLSAYQQAKKSLNELEQALKESKSEARTQKTMDNLRAKAIAHQEKMIEFSAKYPELAKATMKLSEEATKGAKIGYKVGEKVGKAVAREDILNKLRFASASSQGVKDDIVNFVKENLSPEDRGKALVMVRDAKTQKDMTKAFSRINKWAEEAEKKSIRNDIIKTQKKIMDSPSIAIDYKAKVKELMGDFELKGHREETLERLKKTQEFIQSELAKGNDVEIPSRVLKALDILNRTPFEEITISQLTGLRAEMELLENLGRTKFTTMENIWEIQKGKILDEISLQGSVPINKIELVKPEIGERLTLTQKFKNLMWKVSNQASRIDRAITPIDAIFDLLDGGKGSYTGANYRFFKGQIDAGYGKYLTRKDALQNPVIELATKHGLDDTNFERMGVVAAREQDGGVEKLLKSGFTEEQINKVVLTKEETEVLNLMRSTFDSQFPEIQDTMRRVYNQPVEKVKNYFSFMTDFDAMSESEVFERFGSQLPEQYGMPKKNVEAGFTKSRVGGEQKIQINALDIFLKHTDNTSYLLELGEKTKMLSEVASSPRYAELVGDSGQLMVREWLDVIARKGGASGASEIALLDTLRKNVGVGILGLKLSTVAIQPTALIDGMGFIGARYGMRGVKDFMTSADWRAFVAKMPELKDRLGGEFALRELTSDSWLQNIQRKGFIPMQKLDQMTAGMIAAGAYARKMDELGLVMDFVNVNKEALDYAQLAVRRTQASGAFKDVPLAISRGALTGNRSLDRAMLQFQTFLLTRWSRIRHDAIRAGINTKNPKQAVAIMTAMVFAAIAASGIRLGVNKVQDFVTGKEDEDSATSDFAKGVVYEMTGNAPFLGTAISMAMYDGEMFPILDAPKGVISGLNRVITSKSPSAKLRGFSEFAGSTGALLGIPGSAQAEQLARGALQDEKAKPKTKKLKTPAGLPKLPSLKKSLPTPAGLPKLPSL